MYGEKVAKFVQLIDVNNTPFKSRKMKNLIFLFTALSISLCSYAQSDSAGTKTSPARLKNTNEGRNPNQDVQNINNNSKPLLTNSPDSVISEDKMNKSLSDGVIMRDGQIKLVKNGNVIPLDHTLTMSNGTVVMSNGIISHKNGTKLNLTEGQHMDMAGIITPIEGK